MSVVSTMAVSAHRVYAVEWNCEGVDAKRTVAHRSGHLKIHILALRAISRKPINSLIRNPRCVNWW